jgi:molybdate transport system regulatory protein
MNKKKTNNKLPGVKLRVVLAPGIAFGPGKAEILKGVKETGSITSAGRRLGMSYKRAWLLVNIMNHDFNAPLVKASKGGQSGGGAELTPLGEKVLDYYLKMLDKTGKAVTRDLKQMTKLISI